MKLKFKQSIAILPENRVTGANEIIEIKDKKQAQSLIDAGYAEKVVERKKPAPKRVAKKVNKDESNVGKDK